MHAACIRRLSGSLQLINQNLQKQNSKSLGNFSHLFLLPIGRAGLAKPSYRTSATKPNSLVCQSYNNPEIYDIAFSFRNFEQEVEFLLDAYQKYCDGPLVNILEVGCGPAQHSIRLADTAGCKVTAIDISQTMLDFAKQKAEAAGVGAKINFKKVDMTSKFSDSLHDSKMQLVDMGMVLLGTLSHCIDNSTALTCISEMSRLMRPGGLLVLELPHPEELFSGSYYSAEEFVDAWDAAVDEKLVLVEWGREGDEFDVESQVLNRTVGMSLYEGDKLVSSQVEIVQQRQFTLQEIDLIARSSGLKIISVHGDFNMSIPLHHDDAYRMIVCLRK